MAAIFLTEDGRYLLQLRDNIPTIHLPNNWALFGGRIEAGESEEEALRRELLEELAFKPKDMTRFTEAAYEVPNTGYGPIRKIFYEVPIRASDVPELKLAEGQMLSLFRSDEVFSLHNIVPWDEFALRLHARRADIEKFPKRTANQTA